MYLCGEGGAAARQVRGRVAAGPPCVRPRAQGAFIKPEAFTKTKSRHGRRFGDNSMISNKRWAAAVLCLVVVFTCGVVGQRRATVTSERYGNSDGKDVSIFTVTNRKGVEMKLTNYGGIVVSLTVPDRDGRMEDVALGYDTFADYLDDTKYLGTLIGRYGNRIAKGRFTLDGVQYKLAVNNGENHLHGGLKGFDKVVWDARTLRVRGGAAVELSYLSRNGEEGYPGNLRTRVVFTLTDNNELKIDYYATTDRATVVNLTHHGYFNLKGQGNGDILGHQLTINASRFTPTDSGAIPTGELRSVKGTPFDFTKPTTIGERINRDDEQLKFGSGYDHNYVLDGRQGTLRRVAEAYEPTTGRVMEVWTTEPGMQFYTGNFLAGGKPGKGGTVYEARHGFCLETQHFPDSPNKPRFPSTVLRRGGRYRTTTIYKFSAR